MPVLPALIVNGLTIWPLRIHIIPRNVKCFVLIRFHFWQYPYVIWKWVDDYVLVDISLYILK